MNKISAKGGEFAGINRATAAEGWKFEAPAIEHVGKKIMLPADPTDMPIPSAIEHLQRLEKSEQTPCSPLEFIKCFPFDGAVAFQRALSHLFGWATAEMTPGMFGPTPPKLLSIQINHGHDDFVTVPMGEFSLPALPNDHRVGMSFSRQDNGDFGIQIYAKTIRKYENVVRIICKTTREFLEAESIYKGKAFKLFTEDKQVDLDKQPEFIDVGKIKPEDLHLNHDIMGAVETSIFTPMKYTERCRRIGVPLKRGVLLEGPYGVGKSLISTITGRVAVENDWTFITIDNPHALYETLLLARQYQPCVVFCEDIDRAITMERDDEANEILNVVDGILSKNSDVMVVFTTNHVEKISKAMLRPGRLDAVISIRPPDQETIAKLIFYYGKGVVEVGADLAEVCRVLEGQIPATIREVVERSKLHTIPRAADDNVPVNVTADDLYITAMTMTRHLELLNEPVDDTDTAEKLLASLGEFLFAGGNKTKEAIENMHRTMNSHDSSLAGMVSTTKGKVEGAIQGLSAVKEDTEATVVLTQKIAKAAGVR